jgi:hypothetical protein
LGPQIGWVHTADSCDFREPIGFSAFQAKTGEYVYVIVIAAGLSKSHVYKLSVSVILLAIESELMESTNFGFEGNILIREAGTEDTYLLEHPSNDKTNENQQLATRRRTKVLSCESR